MSIVCATGLAAVMATVAPTAPGQAGAPGDPGPARYGRVLDVMPPGQSGTVTTADLVKVVAGDPTGRTARDGKNAPDNFADQLEMYDALNTVRPSSLTGADLDAYYKDSSDFVPDEVVRE